MRRLALLGSFLAISALSPLHAQSTPDATGSPRQVVLLKLDDVVARRLNSSPVSARWQRITEYLKAQQIKGSFGVIGESLEKDNPLYFQWLKDIQSGGLIELWMHGYHMKKADEPGEFDHGTVEEQKATLEKSENLAKAKLGFPFAAFGPHWSATTDATDQALEEVPEVKIWLYGPAKPKYFTRLSIPRIMALENPTFVPDPEKFKATYEKAGVKSPVLVLQGHPDQWDDKRWAGFQEIIAYLKSKNVLFMTPSEYLQTKSAAQ